MSFSFPYLIFILLLIGLTLVERTHYGNRPGREFTHFCCITLYLLFIGLRGYIGTDWYNYRNIFEEIPTLFSGNWPEYWSDHFLEPGFVYFVSAVRTLWDNYHFFVFVSACLDMLILHIFLRRYVKWYTLGFLVFIVMGGLTLCELMRNVRGIGLFLLSLKYLIERRPVPYLAMNILGFFFHFTSVFYLPFYWLLHWRYPRWLLAGIFLGCNAIFFLQIDIARPLLEWAGDLFGGRVLYLQVQYLGNELYNVSYGFSIGYFERILTFLLLIGFYPRLITRKSTNAVFVNAYVWYFLFFFLLSEMRELAARFSLLFICSYWILIPELYETLRVKFNRAVFAIALYGYCLLKIYGMTSIPLYRYDNLLWGIENYHHRVVEFERYYLNR